jgi:membrane protein CcdC involved in cytochrome C biogenesis
MMVFPERMMKGDLPNRDFLHLYGPGALQVLVGWYKVFGISLESERTFGLIQHLAIIFGLFAIRILLHDYIGHLITPLQTAAVFYLMAFGMIVRWRATLYVGYKRLIQSRT